MLSEVQERVYMSDTVDTQPVNQPTRSAGRIIARNTAFGIGAQLALRVASFIFTVLVVRTLGDEHFGRYSIVLAWAGLFSVIGDLGINQYLSREIARDKEASNRLFWDTVILRIILAILASTMTVGGAILLTDYSTEIIVGIAIFTSTYFLQAFLAPLQSLLVGNERVDIMSVMTVLNQVLFMTLAGLFLYLGFDFIWLVIASAITLPIMTLLHYQSIKRNQLGPPRFRINRGLWWGVIRAGMPFAMVQLSLSFAFQVDTIFLSTYTSDAVVGWYNAAYRLTLTLLTLSRSFNDAILPTLAREYVANPDSVRPWYYTSVRFIAMIGLPIAIGGSLLSDKIGLIYGEDFLPATLALAILIWDLPFAMYHSLCGNITTSISREGQAARIYVSIGILNVILNAILVPRIGLVGACFATVITDAIGAVLFYLVLRKTLGAGLNLNRMLRLLTSSLLMALVVLLLRDAHLLVVIAAGGTAYLLIVWFSGAISMDERMRIIQFVQARVPFASAN